MFASFMPFAVYLAFVVGVVVAGTVIGAKAEPRQRALDRRWQKEVRVGSRCVSVAESTQQLDELQAELNALEDQYATEVSAGVRSERWNDLDKAA